MIERWYNELYSSLGDSNRFICCSGETPTTIEEFSEALAEYASSNGRRGGVRLIRSVARAALRELIERLGGRL